MKQLMLIPHPLEHLKIESKEVLEWVIPVVYRIVH